MNKGNVTFTKENSFSIYCNTESYISHTTQKTIESKLKVIYFINSMAKEISSIMSLFILLLVGTTTVKALTPGPCCRPPVFFCCPFKGSGVHNIPLPSKKATNFYPPVEKFSSHKANQLKHP